MNVDVFYDEEEMKHYVKHNGKRLFYPRDYSVDRITDYIDRSGMSRMSEVRIFTGIH